MSIPKSVTFKVNGKSFNVVPPVHVKTQADFNAWEARQRLILGNKTASHKLEEYSSVARAFLGISAGESDRMLEALDPVGFREKRRQQWIADNGRELSRDWLTESNAWLKGLIIGAVGGFDDVADLAYNVAADTGEKIGAVMEVAAGDNKARNKLYTVAEVSAVLALVGGAIFLMRKGG